MTSEERSVNLELRVARNGGNGESLLLILQGIKNVFVK